MIRPFLGLHAHSHVLSIRQMRLSRSASRYSALFLCGGHFSFRIQTWGILAINHGGSFHRTAMKICTSCQQIYSDDHAPECPTCFRRLVSPRRLVDDMDNTPTDYTQPSPFEHPPATATNHTNSALVEQIGGDHYKRYAIQPVQFIEANNIPFLKPASSSAFADMLRRMELRTFARLSTNFN